MPKKTHFITLIFNFQGTVTVINMQVKHLAFFAITQDIIALLLEDNITFELPLEYRKNLVTELRTHSRRMSEDEESAANIPLDWHIMVCNIIRDVLEGRPAIPGFWVSLENCSQGQVEMIFSVSISLTQTVK